MAADRPAGQLWRELPALPLAAEVFDDLLRRPGLRIERIVSDGQCSPPDFWYEQEEHEWILLLAGEARLRFADEAASRHLRCGDYLDIAAGRRHRVDWTPAGQATVWLAVFYPAANGLSDAAAGLPGCAPSAPAG